VAEVVNAIKSNRSVAPNRVRIINDGGIGSLSGSLSGFTERFTERFTEPFTEPFTKTF
jgi:hypothetical protein